MIKSFLHLSASALGLCACVFAAATPARADYEVFDMGTLVPETVYEFPAFKNVMGQYTPSVSGSVKFDYDCSPLELFTSPTHEETTEVHGTHSYGGRGQIMSYPNLEAGKTYYLFYPGPLNGGTLVIHEGEVKIEFVDSDPSTNPESPYYYGGKLSLATTYRIYVDFNLPVTCGNVFLVTEDGTREQVSVTSGSTSISCEVAQPLVNLYKEGLVKGGDTLTLRILQIKDASNPDVKYGTSGKLEIPFVLADMPGQLASTGGFLMNYDRNVLDSYYFPGDPHAVFSLNFDRELSADHTPTASITYGDADNIELGVYTESFEGRVQGKTAYFDFSGVLRRPADMLPGSTPEQQPSVIFISFANFFTTDNQRVFTGTMANPYSYGISASLNTLQFNIAADFSPVRGSALVPGSPLEVWVMNGANIRFDGVAFEYVEDGVAGSIVVPFENVTATPDELSEEDMVFTLTVPEFRADADSDIIVRFTNLVCSDGLDHADDVMASFKAALSGIQSVDAEESFDVFNIAGVRVLSNASRADLNSLPKGVYIAGGRKIILK